MPLSCSCDFDYDFEPGDWYYMGDSGDFIKSEKVSECRSCKKQISAGDFCISFERYRYPHNESEAVAVGFFDLDEAMEDEATIRVDDHFICEKCGEIYLNLQSVGFECISPSEDMNRLLKDYQAEYAPPKLTS